MYHHHHYIIISCLLFHQICNLITAFFHIDFVSHSHNVKICHWNKLCSLEFNLTVSRLSNNDCLDQHYGDHTFNPSQNITWGSANPSINCIWVWLLPTSVGVCYISNTWGVMLAILGKMCPSLNYGSFYIYEII